MLRIKESNKDCAGKYLINKNNIGLMVIVANQSKETKTEFIFKFLEKVESYLEDIIEDDYEKCLEGADSYLKDIPF